MIRKTFTFVFAVVAVVTVGLLGAFINDSLIHRTACRDACLRDGTKIYHQSEDICVCTDMRTMRRGPVSCIFRGTP